MNFITVPTAAQQSGLSEKYIRKLCHVGTLRASCIQEARGPVWQIERASWDAFLASRDGWLGDVAKTLAGKAHTAAEITTAIRQALDAHGLEVRKTIRKPTTWVRGKTEICFEWQHGTIRTTDWEEVNDSGKEDSTK